MGFIKVLNPAIRDELSKAGFNYITERYTKDKESYAFADCKELRKILMEKYAKEEYFFSSRLCF